MVATRPTPRSGILDIAAYVPGASHAAPGLKTLKLSSNETPLGASPAAIAAFKAQADKLAKILSDKTGKAVKLNATVDESLIGGLIVKVGSKMIDSSIRSKLNSLQNTMKEVG